MCNINQSARLNKHGDLYVTIGADIKIEDVFPDDDNYDKHRRDFQWRMFGLPSDEI